MKCEILVWCHKIADREIWKCLLKFKYTRDCYKWWWWRHREREYLFVNIGSKFPLICWSPHLRLGRVQTTPPATECHRQGLISNCEASIYDQSRCKYRFRWLPLSSAISWWRNIAWEQDLILTWLCQYLNWLDWGANRAKIGNTKFHASKEGRQTSTGWLSSS